MSESPRTIVLGAAGQVGSSLVQLLGANGVGIARSDADITNKAELYRALEEAGPVSALINAAAYTDVERAESERELAFAVNADAAGWAAEWTAERNIPFVHYSTEYVFPDGSDHLWCERDATVPVNTYGESKRAGELAVRNAYPESVVIRTSWVYSEQPSNFVRKVLQLAQSTLSLTMVSDQIGRPTFAPDLAHAALRITQDAALRSRIQGGVLHFASGRAVSRADFARAIIDVGVVEGVLSHAVPVVDTTSDQYVTAARRPLRCVLDVSQAEALGLQLGRWEDSLPIAVRAARQ
jgi:dTDP-4-dehydrorhamnose reductase